MQAAQEVILGFDTATAACTAAVFADGEVRSRTQINPERLFERPAHGRELLATVQKAMDDANVSLQSITAIAIGVGPGAFTGLRIGVTTARALASACAVGLRPVSSLAALAHNAAAQLAVDSILAVVDAKRGQLFVCAFGRSGESVEALSPRRAIQPGEVADIVALASAAGSVAAVGDGALLEAASLRALGVEVPPADSRLHLVDAGSICLLAADRQSLDPNQVVPDYLREPDIDPNVLTAIGRAAEKVAGE